MNIFYSYIKTILFQKLFILTYFATNNHFISSYDFGTQHIKQLIQSSNKKNS